MSVVAVGLNHRTVPLDLLERMTVPSSRLPKALADLTSRDHVTEAVVLSTCNRIEVYAFAEKFHGAYQDIRNFFAEVSHVAPEEFSDHLVGLYDGDAARHLFSVASGLDSAVLGEHEILGQVRTAWEAAAAEGAVGPVLNPLFRHALEVGKRVRTETAISRNITSVSQAAVAMATDRLGTLEGRRVPVVGAGEMGEGLARALHGGGVAEILVANRTWERAVDVAERLAGIAVRLDDLPHHLAEVDVLLTSTGASAVILEHGDLATVVSERQGSDLLVVDIAVPRDVDPAAGEIDGVTLLDMDDLRDFAEAGIRERIMRLGGSGGRGRTPLCVSGLGTPPDLAVQPIAAGTASSMFVDTRSAASSAPFRSPRSKRCPCVVCACLCVRACVRACVHPSIC